MKKTVIKNIILSLLAAIIGIAAIFYGIDCLFERGPVLAKILGGVIIIFGAALMLTAIYIYSNRRSTGKTVVEP